LSLVIIDSNKLRVEILDFEREQLRRVKDIIKNAQDAHELKDTSTRAKVVDDIRKGKKVAAIEQWSLTWEVDTDDGDQAPLEDDFDKGDHHAFNLHSRAC
jgi:hypothetical protein